MKVFTPPYPSDNTSEGNLRLMAVTMECQRMGKFGFETVNGAGPHTGNFAGIKATSGGCTITAITGEGTELNANQVLAAGDVLWCQFTSITLSASDNAILIKSQP